MQGRVQTLKTLRQQVAALETGPLLEASEFATDSVPALLTNPVFTMPLPARTDSPWPKELVTLSGKGMWGLSREFNEEYCAHVIRWFNAQS